METKQALHLDLFLILLLCDRISYFSRGGLINVYKIFAVLGGKCVTKVCYYLGYLLDGTRDVKAPACNCLQPHFSARCELSKSFWKRWSFKTLLFFSPLSPPLKWEGITDDLSHDSSNTQSFISRDLKIINFLFQAIT